MANSVERRPKKPSPQPDPSAKLDAALLAEWNARLKQADPKLMTPAEEEAGIQYGAKGAKGVEFVEQTEDDRRVAEIAKAIAREPGNELWKVPPDLAELRRTILALIRECRKNDYGEPIVGVHTSCVTGDPCVFIQLPEKHPRAGVVLHLPTVEIESFVPAAFAEEVANTAKIDVRLKP